MDARCGLLAALLTEADRRLVLAESCTAGLVAASLGRVPGISRHLCGSLVSYRESAKTNWLGVPPSVLQQHTVASEAVARLMATGALVATPEADLAASVTGHLGPNAPPEQDGLIYVGVVERHADTETLPADQPRTPAPPTRSRPVRAGAAAGDAGGAAIGTAESITGGFSMWSSRSA